MNRLFQVTTAFFMGVMVVYGVVLYEVPNNLSVISEKRGMIKVASGQYECTLETKEDKTKDWVCAEVVSEQS